MTIKYFFWQTCQQYNKYDNSDNEKDKTDINNTSKYLLDTISDH